MRKSGSVPVLDTFSVFCCTSSVLGCSLCSFQLTKHCIFSVLISATQFLDHKMYPPLPTTVTRKRKIFGSLLCLFMYVHNNHCHRTTAHLQLNLLLLSSSSSSSLCRVFILIFLRQSMSLGNTVLQLFCCYCSWCLYVTFSVESIVLLH